MIVRKSHSRSADSKRSSPSLLARQLRLRLVADSDSDIPRNLQNIAVSIHAIATFQALHDYLRPRVAGLTSGSSRLSGMFAALAASGYPTSAASRAALEEALQAARSGVPSGSNSEGQTQPTSASGITRRRSQRLSAKNATASTGTATSTSVPVRDSPSNQAEAGSSASGPPPSASAQDTEEPEHDLGDDDGVLDPDLHDDFSDDDIDAEVYGDEDEEHDVSISEKTVTLSVAEGKIKPSSLMLTVSDMFLDGSKVEAQTPDGTRVATPSAASNTPTRTPGGRASYAAALKAKPTDWHLQFSMDDHVLPLDLTIYGAIHQHEQRKNAGATPLHLIWQGIYTIKFKKVPGPAPSAESGSIYSSLNYGHLADKL